MHNSSKTVILYGFQGNARLAKGTSPLIAKGHIGLSADNGKTIYSFGPIKPDDMSENEFIVLPKRKRQTFDGMLTDGTILFNQVAAGKFNKNSRKLELYRLEQTVDDTTFAKVLLQIEKRGKGSKYMLPHENIPFVPNTYNCATFWGQTGVVLPEKSGILRDYIPAMIDLGAERVLYVC